MRFDGRRSAAILLALGLTALTACTTDGAPTRGPVDLDTGKYATMGSEGIPQSAFDELWPRTQSVRLADHLVFAKDVDPALVSTALPTQPMPTVRNTLTVVPGLDKVPVMKKYRYGFVTSNSDGKGDLGFNHAVFVFDSPTSARQAVTAIRDTIDADKKHTTGHKRAPIPGTPAGTVSLQQTMKTLRTAIGVTPVGASVMYSWAQSDNARRSAGIVASALTKQKALLDAMPAPSDDKDPDPTGLLRGTLRDDDDNPLTKSVFGARGAAELFDDQPATYAALQKAGVENVAVNGTDALSSGR